MRGERDGERERGAIGPVLRSSQSIHFSARRLFFQESSEQPTLQSAIKLWRTWWKGKIRKKEPKGKAAIQADPFQYLSKKERKKNWRMHISPRSELDASLLSVDTRSLFHPLPLLIFT